MKHLLYDNNGVIQFTINGALEKAQAIANLNNLSLMSVEDNTDVHNKVVQDGVLVSPTPIITPELYLKRKKYQEEMYKERESTPVITDVDAWVDQNATTLTGVRMILKFILKRLIRRPPDSMFTTNLKESHHG